MNRSSSWSSLLSQSLFSKAMISRSLAQRLFLILSVFLSAERGFALGGANCILIDLDDTLIQSVGKAKSKLKCDPERCAESLIQVGSSKYFVFPGTWELIQASLANPQYELRIFSAGGDDRNQEAVQKILSLVATRGKTSDSSAADVMSLRSKVKLFSREATLESERGEKGSAIQPASVPDPFGGVRKFFGHRKKDIQSVGCNLESSVLIDDNPTVVLKGQIANLLTFPSDFEYRKYSESGFHFSTAEERLSYFHLYYVQGLLLRASKRAERQGLKLPQALFSFQYDGARNEEGPFRVSQALYDYRIYEEGYDAFNPKGKIDWQKYPVVGSGG